MKITTTILLSIFTLVSFGQQFADKVFLYRVVDSYENDSVGFAKSAFTNFIKTKPTSIYKVIALYFLAEIANESENIDTSITLYKQVLQMTFPDSIDNNYKNSSAKELAEIYIDKKDFKTALEYLELTKQEAPYRHFCGNAYADDNIYMADLYSDCYIAQGDFNKAIEILIPHMFHDGLADNSILVKKLYSTYLKVYLKEEIKNEFINAYKTLEIKEEILEDQPYFRPLIKIFNKQVFVFVMEIEFNFLADKMTVEQQRQRCFETIKDSEIYKLATAQ